VGLLPLAYAGASAPDVPAAAKDAAAAAGEPSFETLTTSWPGPYGGLPPVDLATPAAIEAAYVRAVEAKRTAIRRIATDTSPPTFGNSVAALEASGTALARIDALLGIFTSTASNADYAAVASRVLPMSAGLEDEIAHDDALFARVDAVFKGLPASATTAQARRLVAVWHQNMVRRGAGLKSAAKDRLKQINSRLVALSSQFAQNVAREEESLVVYVDDVTQLQGLSDEQRAAAKAAAQTRGKPDAWAIPIQRPTVWPVLTRVDSREVREQVFRLWASRGDRRGEFDNAPVMAEILQLRGEKARLLGFPSYAHYATAGRMAGTPATATAMMERAWNLLLDKTRGDIAELQALSDAEGHEYAIEKWDRLYYAEKLRQKKFSLDGEAVKPYLALGNVVDGMMWAAGRTYGFAFRKLQNIAVVSPDIDVFEVSRGGRVIGVLYVDLYQRKGKGPSSWAATYRTAERGQGSREILPVVVLHSNAVHALDGKPTLLAWEVANVIFHEFGHALHMLANGASYPSLGTLGVPWDFIEVPSLLNERWLLDSEVLRRFALHYQTREPMPANLIDKVEQGLQHDRVFSVTLDYLATAIVDMRLHLMADGRAIDAVAQEKLILEQIGMPSAVMPTLGVSHAFHTFSAAYAAGVYTYLWSDVIAADIAEAFTQSRGGLYDPEVAQSYWRTILSAGNTRPMDEAFREFRGRSPDADALFRRFDLLPRP